MVNRILRGSIFFFIALSFSLNGFSQRYLAELDSSLFIRDTIRPFLKRFENLRFSGYIQPQFQVAQSKGAKSYAGGDFSAFSANRFMLRRARVKLDYLIPDSHNKFAKALFSFQIDATERGVNVRDMFVRLYDTKFHLFSVTAGLFSWYIQTPRPRLFLFVESRGVCRTEWRGHFAAPLPNQPV